jgi:ribose/xylose/arabinose/galactoside ABC-type transport system permease subunit
MVGYAFWLGSSFLNSSARLLDLHQNTPEILTALGLCMCLIAGQFDLSVGSVVTLTCYLSLGLTSRQGLPFAQSLVVCFAVAVAVGLINAILVLKLKVNAFIATLASGGVVAGIAAVYSGGQPLSPGASGARQIPSWFSGLHSLGSFQTKAPEWILLLLLLGGCAALAQRAVESASLEKIRRTRRIAYPAGLVAGVILCVWCSAADIRISWPIVILFVAAFVLWAIIRYLVFGRSLHAVGSNPLAARLSGVSVVRNTAVAFVLSAVLSALAGIVLAANQGSASPDIGAPYLLPAFAAAFLSTVLFSSGRFHVWGTLLGGYLLVEVGQGLIVGGLYFTWTGVVNGAVLAVAVSLATILRRNK